MKGLFNNLVDDNASFTADDEDTFNPVTNLLVKRLADFWQTLTAGTKTISIILNTAVSIREISLAYHNLVAGDVVTVQSFADGAFSGTPIEKVLTITDDLIYGFDSSDVFHTTRYYRVVIEKNIGSSLYVGFLFMGLCDFEYNHVKPSQPRKRTTAKKSESNGWQNYNVPGESGIIQDFVFRRMPQREYSWIELWNMGNYLYDNYLYVPGIIIPTYKDIVNTKAFFGCIDDIDFSSGDGEDKLYTIATAQEY